MAIVKRTSLSYTTDVWDSFFNGLNCSLISASGGVVNIDNFMSIVMDGRIAIKKGSTTLLDATWNFPINTVVCCNDTLVYVQLNDPQSRRFALLYEKISGKILYATAGQSGNVPSVAWFPITAFTLTDNDTALIYTHKARLNYADEMGHIDYVDEVLFDSSDYRTDIEDPNFVACSTVPTDQVITFQGKNYYSIGANTLVLIDD